MADDFKMGTVIIPELTAKPISDVRRAAEAAGITESVRDIRARNQFIRAVRELQKSEIIEEGSDGALRDKISDDEYVSFQFSKRYVEAAGATYTPSALVRFHKETARVECDDPKIRELAEQLIDKVSGVFATHDITAFVHRVVRKDTRKISVGTGSFFINSNYPELVKQLEAFYKNLGAPCLVLPVNQSSGQGQSLVKHVVHDLQASMASLVSEITKLKESKSEEGEPALTKRIAARRMKDLRKQLSEYRELATALHVELKDILALAGKHAKTLVQATMPSDALVAAIQKGETIDQTVAALLIADEVLPEKFVIANTDNAKAVDIPEGEVVNAPVDLFTTVK
jgi:hypothetical protein